MHPCQKEVKIMSTPNMIVKSTTDARVSKLQNKKSHLENLLRSRERLTYEIQNLKKSIAKDKKLFKKQTTFYRNAKKSGVALESVVVSGLEEDDFLFIPQDIEESFGKANVLLNEVFELLLKFDEE